MQESQHSDALSDDDSELPIADLEVSGGYVGLDSAVEQIVAQVERMVVEFGDPKLASGFNSRKFVNLWLESYVPALGGKPSRLLYTKEGRAQVQQVLDCSWSGAYA